MNNFAENLKSLRELRGVTQFELANAVGLGQSHISAWELKISKPTLESAIKIADFFGVSVDYLVGREEEDGRLIVSETLKFRKDNEILKYYNALPKEIQSATLEYLRVLSKATTD